LSVKAIVQSSTRANWLNGTALEGQKAIAKSLLKLRFNTVNIQSYASAASGPGWQTRMNAALADWLKTHTPKELQV
jgi:uncharacterized protein (DUF4415 family)